MTGGAHMGRDLLVTAQVLFMVLPLMGGFMMRKGKPTRLHWPKVVIIVMALIAFSLLTAMFYLTTDGKPNWPGVIVCSCNLGLRLIEAARCVQLHVRALAVETGKGADALLPSGANALPGSAVLAPGLRAAEV